MSNHTKPNNDSDSIKQIADAFETTLDPLAEFESRFLQLSVKPFNVFKTEILQPNDLADITIRHYESVFSEWSQFMRSQDRHPVCPKDSHVINFIQWQLNPKEEDGKDNHPRTVKGKLRKLNRAYEYWQKSAVFPHPRGYNPIQLAREKVDLSNPDMKKHRRIPVEELREMITSVKNIKSRAIIGMQFKLGLRVGELVNIKLSDLSISNSEVQGHHPQLEAGKTASDYKNTLYVPSGNDRDGNKSRRPRILPIDDELQRLLIKYLLVRPDNGEQWVFLNDKTHSKLNRSRANKMWKKEFHPEYAESNEYRPITSHFGRHRFSTWWRVEQGINRELVEYMRGDKAGSAEVSTWETIDAYLHTYYEDICDTYLDNIYQIGL